MRTDWRDLMSRNEKLNDKPLTIRYLHRQAHHVVQQRHRDVRPSVPVAQDNKAGRHHLRNQTDPSATAGPANDPAVNRAHPADLSALIVMEDRKGLKGSSVPNNHQTDCAEILAVPTKRL